jgi:hypothetical protein
MCFWGASLGGNVEPLRAVPSGPRPPPDPGLAQQPRLRLPGGGGRAIPCTSRPSPIPSGSWGTSTPLTQTVQENLRIAGAQI